MTLFPASRREGRAEDVLTRDVRSWKVRTRLDGAEVGTIEEVLLDEDGRPRHLDVDLAHDDRHILLPVGHAALDPDDEVVWIEGLAREALGDLPPYPGDPAAVEPAYESTLGVAWDRAYGPDAFYASPHFVGDWTGGRGAGAPGAAARRQVRVDTLDDVDVAEHDPDPRGWTVVGRGGERLGVVEHLMGDLEAMKVRYLTVKLDTGAGSEDRRILVPAGHADLEPGAKRVRVDALDPSLAKDYPAWTGGPLEREHERRITEHLETRYEGAARYRHPRYRAGWLREEPTRG